MVISDMEIQLGDSGGIESSGYGYAGTMVIIELVYHLEKLLLRLTLLVLQPMVLVQPVIRYGETGKYGTQLETHG